MGRLVLYLRRAHQEAVGRDDFLVLGLIALAYGSALSLHTYGFLAVFAAALAVRRVEMQHTGEHPAEEIAAMARAGTAHEIATDPQTAPAYMTETALAFTEQLDRIGELGMVLLLGAMLSRHYLLVDALWFVPVLLLVIRPVATGARAPRVPHVVGPTADDRLVWDSRDRVALLSVVRAPTRGAPRPGPPADRAHPGGGGGVDRRARPECDPPDAPVRHLAGPRPR